MGTTQDDGIDGRVECHELVDALLDKKVCSGTVGLIVFYQRHPERTGYARHLNVGKQLLYLHVIAVTADGTATIVYEVEPKELAPTLAADISRLSFVSQHGAAMAITAAAGDDAKGTLTITATPSGFDGSKDYSLSLIYSEDARSYQTAYTPVYVITHPTAGSLAITIPTTSGGKYAVGASYQLGAVFTPAYITETDVTWSVDDTTLATIDANGVLTPIKNGTVTITCTSKDNPAVTATITIEITGGNIPLDEGGVSQGGAE